MSLSQMNANDVGMQIASSHIKKEKTVFDSVIEGLGTGLKIAGEFFYVNDISRVITGADPITGEETNRWEAAAWLGADLISLGGSKILKGVKVISKTDDILDAAKAIDKVDDVNDAVKAVDKVEDSLDIYKYNPLENVTYSDKVKKQMLQDDFHGFPRSVDAFGGDGKISIITGRDGIVRKKLEISGTYKNRKGIFEYIIESDNSVNHRMFIPK